MVAWRLLQRSRVASAELRNCEEDFKSPIAWHISLNEHAKLVSSQRSHDVARQSRILQSHGRSAVHRLLCWSFVNNCYLSFVGGKTSRGAKSLQVPRVCSRNVSDFQDHWPTPQFLLLRKTPIVGLKHIRMTCKTLRPSRSRLAWGCGCVLFGALGALSTSGPEK
jgi:hypothetical protein